MSLLLPSACACVRTVLPICNGPSLSAAKAAPPVIVIAGGFGAVLPCHHASTQDGVSQLLVYLNRRSRASHQDPVTASAAMRTAGGREVGTLCPLGRGGGALPGCAGGGHGPGGLEGLGEPLRLPAEQVVVLAPEVLLDEQQVLHRDLSGEQVKKK